MSWERDPLWAKAKLFFQHAFDQPRDTPNFGLWCALGLELLARAAIASVSPTLLAEPDRDQKHLLHALNRGSERVPRKSIGTAQVLTLCQQLFVDFTPEDQKAANALISRRNDELHSGAAAFEEYTTNQWISGFYRCCRALCLPLDESLESLFGADEATVAIEVLDQTRKEVIQRVKNAIAAHRSVYEGYSTDEKMQAAKASDELAKKLAYQRHHRVVCPACENSATVQGTTFGRESVTQNEGKIVVKQAVVPNAFTCSVCRLKLNGYAELKAADLGDQYTRTTTYEPDVYYNLIDPANTDAINELVADALSNNPDMIDDYLFMDEYDNE
ncbi:hypothetical protein DTL21_06835 [Bremerella cremea]|uniref:Uncharacterized protein n=1 Tax=Blastopirellula marina TaxID=124 RepID=A0A2S8FZN0_9BACT|nr:MULTISPECIES: hypothetical protein [Pirellulaceae]PQO37655.1 hypothetical protein C5Y83_06835 [Blastopirellula marina]RCS50042.1 hypothetical protein DTL21_06835 [Bremerella cremea]